jgi:hypothetical protein
VYDHVEERLLAANIIMKFWEKLIAYFPFTSISVSDMTNIKETLVCMHNEANKII